MGDHLQRLRTNAMAPFRIDSDALDVGAFLIVAAFLAVGFATRCLQLASQLRLPLPLLAVSCLAMPSAVATSQNATMRLPVFLCLLLAASGSWRAASRRALAATAAVFALLLAARSGVVAGQSIQAGRFIAEVRQALAQMPQGARRPGGGYDARSPPHACRMAACHLLCRHRPLGLRAVVLRLPRAAAGDLRAANAGPGLSAGTARLTPGPADV